MCGHGTRGLIMLNIHKSFGQMKLERKCYDQPLAELIPMLPLECYCGISGGEYNPKPGEFDEDSD
jgi:hypothetical protein